MDEETYPQSQVGISLLKRGVSFNKMRIILASYGWESSVYFEKHANRKKSVRIGLSHKHWHETLASVSLYRNLEITDISDTLNLMYSTLAELGLNALQTYDGWVDKVPFFINDQNGERWVENERETEYLRNYPSPRVVAPERAKPIFDLPGWKKCILYAGLEDFVVKSPEDNGLEDMVSKILEMMSQSNTFLRTESDLSGNYTFDRFASHSSHFKFYIFQVGETKYQSLPQREISNHPSYAVRTFDNYGIRQAEKDGIDRLLKTLSTLKGNKGHFPIFTP